MDVALPMPLEPPVMMTTLPWRDGEGEAVEGLGCAFW